jgi:conjugative transfer ATPase
MNFSDLRDFFKPRSPSLKEVKSSYYRAPSLSDKLPWVEYCSSTKTFPLADGRSFAAVFELGDVASEARSDSYLTQLQQGFQGIFQDVFPLYFNDESPWIVQFYIQDELSLLSLNKALQNYIQPPVLETNYTQHFLELMQEHTAFLTQPQGIFRDEKVSGNLYRGKQRRIRAVIYRKLHGNSKLRKGRTAIQDLNNIAHSFQTKFASCGVKVKRYTGEDFYKWMVSWFNPKPKGFANTDELLGNCPYPGDEAMPFGYDFSERFFFSTPESSQTQGVWYFDDLPHKYLSIMGLNSLPRTGHITAERAFGNHFYGLYDKFPEGSVFQLTVVLQSQEQVKNHIFRIENSMKHGSSTEAEMAREDARIAKRAIESNNYLFPTSMGVYIRGNSLDDLYIKETDIETLLASNGLICIDGDHELLPLDNYLNYLPMCYNYTYDRKYLMRSRYLSGKQLSQLLPLYGRERGTEHSGLIFYNRGGEPFTLDPLNPRDKDFNSHLFLLGTTGSGKSACFVYLLMLVMAIYRPRLFIIDAGNSFGLLSTYFKSHGFSVNRVEISLNTPISLNPFAESKKMLEQVQSLAGEEKHKWVEEVEKEIEAELESITQTALDTEDDAERDYMAEMCYAAQLMITGCEQKEEDRIMRQHRMLIMDALILAANNAKTTGFAQMIPGDLADAMCQMAEKLDSKNSESQKANRLREMADGIRIFCKDPLSAMYFNQRGKPWPAVDVTVFEMGLFKEEGYEAQRALAFMGVMNKAMSLAEQQQHETRATIFALDETHIIMKNPITVAYTTKCSKMSRKLGLWLWLASQNIQDFPAEARKILSMIEFWLCLGMSEAELAEVERFKPLTEEERILFRSVRKDRGKYVEGVLLCNRLKGLFRNIPPRLSLALAMTEKEEKAERKQLMQRYGYSEVEAAMHIAKQLLRQVTREVNHE